MASWVDKYKERINSSHRTHVILDDKDQLLSYPELQQAVEDAGYQIFRPTSTLDVRCSYELEVAGHPGKSLIVAPPGYIPLPDILSSVHFESIGLKDLFPHLDAKSIQGLSFNALCLLSNIKPYEELGRDKTLKFLLENVYNVDFDTLTGSRSRERVLNALIVVLLEKNGINKALNDFLEALARPHLPELVATGLTRENLIAFVQEKWSEYLATDSTFIDFQESVLNKSFGYLFIFDYLAPVKVSREKYSQLPRALAIGVYVDEKESNDRELEALIQYLQQQEPVIEDVYHQWFAAIQVLAKAKLRDLASSSTVLKEELHQVTVSLNNRFQRFLDNVYGSLFSLSGVRRPVLVTRVLEYVKAQPERRKVLIVIDCMNYWQWLLIAKSLNDRGIKTTNNNSIAYVPSITAWSRQALFRGSKPILEEGNSKEHPLFSTYWMAAGYGQYQIAFHKFGVHEQFSVDSISDDIDILGLVCNDLDDITHGSILGNNQLLTSTNQWVEKCRFVELIENLHSKGFKIFVTTDHGNIEAEGIRNLKLKEKIGTLSRSRRYIQFSNQTMLAGFREENPNLNFGVRDNSIYLRNEEAFVEEGKRIITHGGSHLWEVLIPFAEIS